jgi:ribonuclease HI
MDEVFSSQPDLTDQLISHPDVEYFTDGSSFVQDGTCFAGYAEVILDAVTEAHPLLVRTSAQKAELIVLMQVLQLTAGVRANTYTDSKYTCTTIHVHRALDKERGLINLTRKNFKYGQGILELLEAVWAPKRVVFMHC